MKPVSEVRNEKLV